jgi:uncharacterized protein
MLKRLLITTFLPLLLGMMTWVTIPNPVAQAIGVYSIPNLIDNPDLWLYDQAKELSISTERKLTSTLEKLAQDTGKEVRMVMIDRLDYGDTIETFTNKVFSKWFPETADQTNEAVIIVDALTKSTAVAAGDGVKDLISPDILTSVVEETIPYFLREDKFNQALIAASDRVASVMGGLEDPGAPVIKAIDVSGNFATAEETDDRQATIWVVVLIVLATVIPMVTYFWYVN